MTVISDSHYEYTVFGIVRGDSIEAKQSFHHFMSVNTDAD